VHRLEVVVHRVFDAANRIDHERQGVVVKRIAAIGLAERLGIVRWSRKGDRRAVTRGCRNGQEQTLTVTPLHAVDPEATLGSSP
jgi:hypothetical protein